MAIAPEAPSTKGQILDISPVGRVEGDLDVRVDIRDGVVVDAWTQAELFRGFRYAAELRGATPLLAFGDPPDRQTGWIADVLEDAGIGFAARVDGELLPLNATGRALRLFA